MISLLTVGSFSYAKSDVKPNQDAILLPVAVKDGFLFAIADGVGSYENSGLASKIAVESLEELFLSEGIDNSLSIINKIKLKIESISNGDQSYEQPATTLTFCHVSKTKIIISHVGDCRFYILSNGKLLQLTKDHTQHQKLLDEKLFTKAELRGLSGKNTLTSAISKGVDAEIQTIELPVSEFKDEEGDVNLFIMSDGAHHIWHQRPKFSIRTMSNPLSFCASLLRRINKNGPIDDHSLIALKIRCK